MLAAWLSGSALAEPGVMLDDEALQISATEFSATNPPAQIEQAVDRVRSYCIDGRRMICGKILRVLPEGLVIESGYISLLRPPLTSSWLVPGTVTTRIQEGQKLLFHVLCEMVEEKLPKK